MLKFRLPLTTYIQLIRLFLGSLIKLIKLSYFAIFVNNAILILRMHANDTNSHSYVPIRKAIRIQKKNPRRAHLAFAGVNMFSLAVPPLGAEAKSYCWGAGCWGAG